MFSDTYEIRTWLSSRTDVSPYGAKLLNMAYTEAQRSQIFEVYSELASLLRRQPEMTIALIRGEGGGWYSSIIGNVVAILQRNSDLAIELANSIVDGSWAAPQLAAGFAIITNGNGTSKLEKLLDETAVKATPKDSSAFPKKILSAYAALKLTNNEIAHDFSSKQIFKELLALDQDRCIRRAERYFEIWENIPAT